MCYPATGPVLRDGRQSGDNPALQQGGPAARPTRPAPADVRPHLGNSHRPGMPLDALWQPPPGALRKQGSQGVASTLPDFMWLSQDCGVCMALTAMPPPCRPLWLQARALSQTIILSSSPGTNSITTNSNSNSNSRSTIVSSGGSTTAVAFERVACSVGADQLVVELN